MPSTRTSSGIEAPGRVLRKNRYECAGGIVVPKVNIGAIRGGVPWKITKTVQQCAIYVDVRITPVQEPLDVRDELRRLMDDGGLAGEVELYVFRPASKPTRKKRPPPTSDHPRSPVGSWGRAEDCATWDF